LNLFRRESPVTVLGPGSRAVLWVQGCPLACRGCIVPDSWEESEGEAVPVSRLSEWVLEQAGIEGITLSGGEPMAQAGPLAELIESVRARSDLGVACYTGYTYDYLIQKGSPDQHALLRRVDLLVDGPYVERLHADLLWRGSSNQRLLPLTDRYRAAVEALPAEEDRSAGLQITWMQGKIGYAGVPPFPDFDHALRTKLARLGVLLEE
jgi:anaerobic ribonucleoside-triphosphate reductase activating protein